MRKTHETIDLLRRWADGDKPSGDALFALLYDELRSVASRRLAAEHAPPSLQTTELVHEAFLRLAENRVAWQERAHFFAIAARVMRRIVIDQARASIAEKRGGGLEPITLPNAEKFRFGEQPSDLLELDRCLKDLARHDPEKATLVNLRFFAGLSLEETAEILGKSRATVIRRWRVTKGWLHRQLTTPDTAV